MFELFLSIARAEDPAEPAPAEAAPETIELRPEEALPSALDGLGAASAEVSLDGSPLDWVPLPGNLLRGKLFARPVLGVERLAEQPASVRLGAALGHRWWTLAPRLVSFGGEERLEVSAPVGGARGRRVELATAVGPWVGPVGLRVGPAVRWDRADWGGVSVLDDALLVGAGVDLSVAGGPIAVTVGVEPAWVAVGDRLGADPVAATLPVLGDETTWRAGVGWLGRPLELFLDGHARETAAGTVVEAGLSLHLQLL